MFNYLLGELRALSTTIKSERFITKERFFKSEKNNPFEFSIPEAPLRQQACKKLNLIFQAALSLPFLAMMHRAKTPGAAALRFALASPTKCKTQAGRPFPIVLQTELVRSFLAFVLSYQFVCCWNLEITPWQFQVMSHQPWR